MSKPTKKAITGALGILDNMKEIIEREMIVHGEYATRVVREDLSASGAICGGRMYCAIGSLWVSAGVGPRTVRGRGVLLGLYDRERFTRKRPALRLAYVELNQAAIRYARRNRKEITEQGWGILRYKLDEIGPSGETPTQSAIEALFESGYWDARTAEGRGELLKVVGSARRKIKAMA